MAAIDMKVTVKIAWWFRPSLRALALFCRVTDKVLDLDRFIDTAVALRGIRFVTK
jgi:hypothetical protein